MEVRRFSIDEEKEIELEGVESTELLYERYYQIAPTLKFG